jgi:hypothetical protein
MRHFGLRRCAKLADGILNDTVRVRHAPVLPKVLKPGCYHERLQVTPGLGCILEDVP